MDSTFSRFLQESTSTLTYHRLGLDVSPLSYEIYVVSVVWPAYAHAHALYDPVRHIRLN